MAPHDDLGDTSFDPMTKGWLRVVSDGPPPARVSAVRRRDTELDLRDRRMQVLLWLTIVLALVAGLGLAWASMR